jgi:hypothetical protein
MVGDVMLLLCDTTIHIAINMLLYLWGFPMERGNWIRFLQWIEGLNMVKNHPVNHPSVDPHGTEMVTET